MKLAQIGRVALGTFLGALAGAAWLTVTLIIDARVYTGFKEALSFKGFIVVGGIQFVTVGIVFFVIGIPAYLLSLSIDMRRKIPGIVFGFALGMLGSLGYGVDWHLQNLLFGAAVFGISGALAAGVFLYMTEGRRLDEAAPTAPLDRSGGPS